MRIGTVSGSPGTTSPRHFWARDRPLRLGSGTSQTGKIPMRRKSLFIALIIAVALAIPAVVVASHQFNDVPGSHTFHGDIAWLADEGITRGCNPPANTEFCPDDPVTRGQMAAFMKRFHDQFIAGASPVVGVASAGRASSDPPSTGNGVVDGLTMNLQIPEFGFLVVEASVDMENIPDPDVFGCGINTGGATNLAQADSWRAVDLFANASDTCSTQTALLVSPGSQPVRVVITQALASTNAFGGNISAVLYTADDTVGLLEKGSGEQVEMRPLSDSPKGS